MKRNVCEMQDEIRIAFCSAPVTSEYAQVEANRWPPLWAMSLGAVCKSITPTAEIQYFDGTHGLLQTITDDLIAFKPTVLALSPVLISYQNDLAIARRVKEATGCDVVLGGHHATNLADTILRRRNSFVDAVITGDGEPAFRSFLETGDWATTPNSVTWTENGLHRASIQQTDLNADPIPYLDEIDQYDHFRRQYVFSQKGCPLRVGDERCVFCARIDEGIRFKTPDRMAKELLYYRDVAGKPTSIFDVSDDFFSSWSWLKSLEQAFDEQGILGTPLVVFGNAQRVTDDLASLLARIGVQEVILGFEAADLDSMPGARKKGATIEQNEMAAHLLLHAGVNVIGSYVFGLPGANSATIEACFKQIQRLQKDHGDASISGYANVLIPFPGSPAYDRTVAMFPSLEKEDLLDQHDIQVKYVEACLGLNRADSRSFLRQMYAWRDEMNGITSSVWMESLGLRQPKPSSSESKSHDQLLSVKRK